MLQIFEAGLFGKLLHAVILDRGPLWFDGFNTPENVEAFLVEFNRQFPARFGRKRRFIPEIENSNEVLNLFTKHGFQKTSVSNFETIWLDLTPDLEILRTNLKKNWRGVLQKAEKENITIEWDNKGAHFPWLMQNYAADRMTKGYDGPSVKLLKALAETFIPRGEMLIARALVNGKPIAGIMLLCHGMGATYQIGFSDKTGRTKGAHHILLWHALEYLKQNGITDLDLGGVNNETAKGVKQFKMGMGGTLFSNPGQYF